MTTSSAFLAVDFFALERALYFPAHTPDGSSTIGALSPKVRT